MWIKYKNQIVNSKYVNYFYNAPCNDTQGYRLRAYFENKSQMDISPVLHSDIANRLLDAIGSAINEQQRTFDIDDWLLRDKEINRY